MSSIMQQNILRVMKDSKYLYWDLSDIRSEFPNIASYYLTSALKELYEKGKITREQNTCGKGFVYYIPSRVNK